MDDGHRSAALVFGALANDHRIAIVRELITKVMQCEDPDSCDLSDSCCDVTELAGHLSIGGSTLSYHLKELRLAGVISVFRKGQHLYYGVNRKLINDALSVLMPETGAVSKSVSGKPRA